MFGYAEDKEKYFKQKNFPAYKIMRKLWLDTIGMAISPYSDPYPDQVTMHRDWAAKGVEKKKTVLRKAREERERFVRDRKREEEAKQSGNYKGPEKRPAKKNSANRVSKPCRSSYSYGASSKYSRYGRSNWNNGHGPNFFNSNYYGWPRKRRR